MTPLLMKVARNASSQWARRIGYLILALVLLMVPALVTSSYNLGRFRLALVYFLIALALNIVLGFAGEFSLSYAPVMAASAYGAGMVSAYTGAPLPVALAIGFFVGILVAMILAAPSIRVHGFYLGLMTLFAVLVIPSVVTLIPKSGGTYGLAVPVSVSVGGLSDTAVVYEVTAVAVLVVLLGTRNLIRSSWGTRLRMMREAQRAAEAVGLNPLRIRGWAYLLFAVPVACAGLIIAYGDQYVTSGTFDINLTMTVLTGVILGGKGRLWGPIIGTVPLVLLTFYLGPFSSYNPIIFGVVLMVTVILFPNGIIPPVSRFLSPHVTLAGGTKDIPVSASHMVAEYEEGISHDAPILVEQRTERRVSLSGEPLLTIDGIRKSFGGTIALDGASLTVTGGQVAGVMGQNGSGKSTLLNIVNGFYRADEGRVLIEDIDVSDWATHKRANLGIGRTFQVPKLIGEATVAENIEAGLISRDHPRMFSSLIRSPVVRREERARREQVEGIAALLRLPGDILDSPVDNLPLGLKRIVEVARAAVSQPQLLLLDEPAAGLNHDERAYLGEVLVELCRRGITPVVVEHNVEFIMSNCEHIILMDEGSVVAEFSPAMGETMPGALDRYLRYAPVV